MKLNKVLALALSGVMAVSMLAGCSNNSGNGGQNGGEQPPVVTGPVGAVISALDSDTINVVKFSNDSNLQSVLEKVVKNKGNDVGTLKASDLTGVDSKLSNATVISKVVMDSNGVGCSEDSDKKAETYLGVKVLSSTQGANESYAVQEFAKTIETTKVYNNSKVVADMPEMSGVYNGGDYWYEFEYTGDIAVTVATDAVTGQTTYVMAFTVTRTPTKVER